MIEYCLRPHSPILSFTHSIIHSFKIPMRQFLKLTLIFLASCSFVLAQETPTEEDFYKILTPPIPEGMILEVCLLYTSRCV